MQKFKSVAAAEVLKFIASVSRTAGAYSKAVQVAAIHCIAHAIEHGDVTLATRLVAAVRKHDKALIVAFFEQNGPFAYQKDDSSFLKNKNWKGEFKGEETPHWESAKKPVEPKSMFDVDEALDKFLKSCHAQLKKAKSTKNAELLTLVEVVQAQYNSAKMSQQSKEILAKAVTAVEEEHEKALIPSVKAA